MGDGRKIDMNTFHDNFFVVFHSQAKFQKLISMNLVTPKTIICPLLLGKILFFFFYFVNPNFSDCWAM